MSRWTFFILPTDQREDEDVVAFILNDTDGEYEGDQHVAHVQSQEFQDEFGEVMESTFEPNNTAMTERQVRNRLIDLGYIEDDSIDEEEEEEDEE